MERPEILRLKAVTKEFSAKIPPAVANVSFTLHQGELLGLLGPSGCGKTTLLRIVAGFEKATSGTVMIGGEFVNGSGGWIPPEQRNTGMVFQDYALFPHLNVAENIAFGLKRMGRRSASRSASSKVRGSRSLQIRRKGSNGNYCRERVAEVLNLVRLAGLEKRYPHELSGGQQQRVALARALAPQPALILLDEPLSNLDLQVRQQLREEVRQILKAAATTAIFVTHDREEALAISDRIAVMRQGKLEQIDTPEIIYTQPASRFVAEFVAQANFLPARRRGNLWVTEIGELPIRMTDKPDLIDGELMLRQEELILQPDEKAGAIVRERRFLGREYHYCLETSSGRTLHARMTASTLIGVGTRVRLLFPKEVQIFPSSLIQSSNLEKISA